MLAQTLPAIDSANEILNRLQQLYPKLIDLSLDRVLALLEKLGNPQLHTAPIIHVAGTNGKGSTCAFLRAIAEHANLRVHVTTSPHLVRLNERFRLNGTLVTDAALTAALAEIETINAGAAITVFEVLAAAGYLLFARHPADLCVVEVGLGGRYDATNVIPTPAACAITSISMDHQDFLGDRLDRIAWEKAGILKPGRPAATGHQSPEALATLRACASETGATLLIRGEHWDIVQTQTGLRFTDTSGTLDLPTPTLPGIHQHDNAGIAIAALRASGIKIGQGAYAGIANATWPARLQRLHGALTAHLPPNVELWLDGGHNEGAGAALAPHLAAWSDRPLYLAVGMKQSKDVIAFLRPLLPHAAGIWAVREPGQHLALEVGAVIAASGGVALAGPDVIGALHQIATLPPGRVLICGSLYLAGEVLTADGSPPS